MTFLIQRGAKVNATNNVRALRARQRLSASLTVSTLCASRAAQAGDSPWHWADAMDNAEAKTLLERNGAAKEEGNIIVPEHVDKIKDFYNLGTRRRRHPSRYVRRSRARADLGPKHPLPSKEFMRWREAADAHWAEEQTALIPGI